MLPKSDCNILNATRVSMLLDPYTIKIKKQLFKINILLFIICKLLHKLLIYQIDNWANLMMSNTKNVLIYIQKIYI